MRLFFCILFLLGSVGVYSQTFYAPVVVKKTLRVDGRTALGGIDFTQDLTITADTILINNLDGTGNLLGIDGSGNVLRVTGTGTGGVSGLVPTEVLFGGATGLIDQDADFVYDEALNNLILTNDPTITMYDAGLNYSNEITPDKISITDAAAIDQIDLAPSYMRLSNGGFYSSITRITGGSSYNINLPNANGTSGQALRLTGGLNLEWFTPSTGTVTSIATTSPIGGGTITTTGTLNLLGSAADRMLYTTGVNTWAETVSTSFGRSLMDDANVTAGLTTLGIPVDDKFILFGNGTDIENNSNFTFDLATTLLTIDRLHIDGAVGQIVEYEGNTATNGQLFIGNTAAPAWKTGIITSSDLTVGYSDPDITLAYAAGSILNADINGSAAIDASKINTGVVSNAEFNYMDGVTSSVQTQLDNKGYVLTLTGTQNTVADATSYYTGAIPAGTGTTADINRVYLPMGGTITSCYISFYNSGTLSTGESSTFAIRYDNTTDVTVSTAVLNNATATVASNTGLSQAVSQGHYIEGKFTTATWATNPTNIRWTITIFIRT